MIKVKLTYPYSWPIIKQTPNRSGIWGDCQFYINQDIPECDFWVVFDGLMKKERTKCPPEATLLVTAEPPSIKTYDTNFVNQFGAVLTCHNLEHKNVIHSQQGLNWMVGGKYIKESRSWEKEHTKDYDELTSIKKFAKSKLLSIVISNKSITKGHQYRLKFIAAAKHHFGSDLDVFGIGFNEVADKWDAIYPYKYHITMENSVCRDYWTEKISDAFLAGAYPFYYGCPNIEDYFHPESLTRIDILDERKSFDMIQKCISESRHETSSDKILNSRDMILNKYNLMTVISNFCESNLSSLSERRKTSLSPENSYQRSNFSLGKFKSLLFK